MFKELVIKFESFAVAAAQWELLTQSLSVQ
jgi:hypothetical protein